MIVKVHIREDQKDFSVWDKNDNRLYYSDREADYKLACEVVAKYKTNYFNAHWMNRVVILDKPAKGYSW